MNQNTNETSVFSLDLPPVIFGTSGLGNLFVAMEDQAKLDIVSECVRLSKDKVVFDTAGKYGAGLALETLGICLKQLNVSPEQVTISNKLGWFRTELKTEEPTFEQGVWKNLKHDAVQKISYAGILECFEQAQCILRSGNHQRVDQQIFYPHLHTRGQISIDRFHGNYANRTITGGTVNRKNGMTADHYLVPDPFVRLLLPHPYDLRPRCHQVPNF